MPLPHTLLTLGLAAGLWWAGHAWSCSRPALQASKSPPGFAVVGSAYGSLAARVMRDSLYSYWHGGESATPALPPAAPNAADANTPPPPPPPGRFSRLGRPAPAPPPPPPPAADEPKEPLLKRAVTELARLESNRTKRNSKYPPTAAHRRYINASAGWRLSLAHELDPGDAVLYEILHYHISTQSQPTEKTRAMIHKLANDAIEHGLAPRASMSDALTGAGAALNLLNDQLTRRQSITDGDRTAVLRNWGYLTQCMDRFRSIRREADEQGWWEDIPPVRQEEISAHAALLEKVSETVRKTLVKNHMVP